MKARRIAIAELSIWLIIALLIMVSCGADDTPPMPTQQEEAFAILAGSWDISQGGSIVVDGQDASLNYADFSFSFTDGVYNTTNAGNLFSATGTWTWANEAASIIHLDDGKIITIISLTANRFVFSFEFGGTGGVANGIEGVAGSYTITVNKP